MLISMIALSPLAWCIIHNPAQCSLFAFLHVIIFFVVLADALITVWRLLPYRMWLLGWHVLVNSIWCNNIFVSCFFLYKAFVVCHWKDKTVIRRWRKKRVLCFLRAPFFLCFLTVYMLKEGRACEWSLAYSTRREVSPFATMCLHVFL